MIKVWNKELNVTVDLINFEEAIKFLEINQDWLILETIDDVEYIVAGMVENQLERFLCLKD